MSASADDPPAAVLQRRVEKGLLEPLAQQDKERSRLSRASAPPARGVRVTQAAVTLDASGRAYMAFAVDVRRGSEWRKNEVVGCGYTQTGALFVKWGDDYRPAEILPTLERAARPSGRLLPCASVKESGDARAPTLGTCGAPFGAALALRSVGRRK